MKATIEFNLPEEQESFDDATHAISATKIRREMGLE